MGFSDMSIPFDNTSSALRFQGIEKAFFGIPVLKDINFQLENGKTLGLVGENGAGKSTLMNILGGNLQPDSGHMNLWGKAFAPKNPRDAENQGISFVHQELNLFGNLSIAENLFINRFPKRGGFVHQKEILTRTQTVLRQVGLQLSPKTVVDRLSAGERQLVEISKALIREARLIILDEPTTSLTNYETGHLFRILKQLQKDGITLIYISHTLEEVLEIADNVLILRDGEVVGNAPKETFTQSGMISLMVGRDIEHLFPERTHQPTKEVSLQARRLKRRGVLKDISFELKKGEVLGISGLMGSGRTELARALFGLDPLDSGELLMGGKNILKSNPPERIQAGMAFLTEDRRGEGLCMEASIEENMTLACAPRYASGPLAWLNRTGIRKGVQQYREAVQLTPGARNDQAVRTLSGGNQQKVVLAKWLLNKPSVILLDEPTRGIDVGAKYEVYSLINELTKQGSAVLVISSELEELIGICDRILTMNLGEITAEFSQSEFDRENILKAALSSSK